MSKKTILPVVIALCSSVVRLGADDVAAAPFNTMLEGSGGFANRLSRPIRAKSEFPCPPRDGSRGLFLEKKATR